jgi:hypothetical protein
MTTLAHTRITKGAVKPRKRGLARLLSHHSFRRLTQFAVFAFILGIAIRHTLVGEAGAVVTASWEAYCPFGGFETLYKFIATGGQTVSHTHLSNLVVLVAALVTSLVARNAFCGWLCPFGFVAKGQGMSPDPCRSAHASGARRPAGLGRHFVRHRLGEKRVVGQFPAQEAETCKMTLGRPHSSPLPWERGSG